MVILYIFAGMVVFWSVFLTVVFRIEKRMVWPYSDLQADAPYDDPTGYGALRVAEATRHGFTLLGWARDVKGPIYRVSYGMLVSPERNVLAIVGVGAILRIPYSATWLFTPTVDRKCYYSTDQQSGVQIDISRHWTNQLVPGADFLELLQQHKDWVKANKVATSALTPGREFAEFRALRREHYSCMERTGLIDFIDPAADYFRFTLSGAARTATWGYFLGMARALSRGQFPRNA